VGVDEPANEIYGKLMRITDDVMWRYFDLLSRRSAEDIAGLRAGHPMEAKKALAREMTERFHGAAGADAAQKHFETQHQQGQVPDDIGDVTVLSENGSITVAKLLTLSGLTKSNGDAKRLMSKHAVEVDGAAITEPQAKLVRGGKHVVRCGRKYLRVTID